MALNYILLEDGSGHILLEDGSGSILMENQPGSSSIVFTVTGGILKGTARSSLSTSIVFTPTLILRGAAALGTGTSNILFSTISNMRAYARTPGSSSIVFTMGVPALGGSASVVGTTDLVFTVSADMLCFSLGAFTQTTSISASPIVTNTSGFDDLPTQLSSLVPPPPYAINGTGYDTLFLINSVTPDGVIFPENVDPC